MTLNVRGAMRGAAPAFAALGCHFLFGSVLFSSVAFAGRHERRVGTACPR
jgi:hypothetical protein